MLIFIIDAISTLVLVGTFYLVWKERKKYISLRPIIPAIFFLVSGRIFDMLVEHPSYSNYFNYFNLEPELFELELNVIANINDVVGISLLMLGFIKILEYQKEKEKLIETLETFLPICANCKKFRTDNNEWVTADNYLILKGTVKLSHGICPDCKEELYGDYLRKNKTIGNV